MAVPRGRHTKSRRDKSRAHLFLKKPMLVSCPKCGKLKRPHTFCWNCGHYKGKEIIDVLGKLTKKEKKKREKQMKVKKKEVPKEKAKKRPLNLKDLSRR